MIHVIGDSHVREFEKAGVSTCFIGPATAYGLTNKSSKTQSKEKVLKILEQISINSIVILSFGEIDCRLHIYKQKDKMVERIQESVGRLVYFFIELRQRWPNVYLYNVNPGTWEENVYSVTPFPSLKERALIYLFFNLFLCKFGPKEKIIDIYEHLKDGDLMLSKSFTDDGVHINKKASDLFLFPEIYRIIGGDHE